MGLLPIWIMELWMVLFPDNNDIAIESIIVIIIIIII